MAANCTSVITPSPSIYSPCQRMPSPRFWCRSDSGVDRRRGRETPRLLKIAVSGVTELLRLFPGHPRKQRENSGCSAEGTLVRSVEDVVSILRSDYEQAYFLTGNFTSEIYSEDCLFEDPTIKFYGRDRYSQNLDLLVPFFNRPSLVLEKIEKCIDHEREFILATWILRFSGSVFMGIKHEDQPYVDERPKDMHIYITMYLKLPWMPLISIGGTTTYDLDDEFKIVRHVERWNVSALEAVGQLFMPSRRSDG